MRTMLPIKNMQIHKILQDIVSTSKLYIYEKNYYNYADTKFINIKI